MSDFCYGWPIYKRIGMQAELLDRVMSRLGVDTSLAVRRDNGMAWFEARTRCIDCLHDDRCRAWIDGGLDNGAATGSAPGFCPNAAFFADCREQKRPPVAKPKAVPARQEARPSAAQA